MRDPRLDKLAHVLVNFSTQVKKGDLVAILAPTMALPGVEAVYEAVLKAGGHPYWIALNESLDEAKLRLGTDEQISYLSPIDMYMINTVNVRIRFWAEENSRNMSGIDPRKSALASASRRPIMQRFMERDASGDIRWVGAAYPTLGMAQDADMSLHDYSDFVFGACLLNHPDPAASWRKIRDTQQQACDWLNTRKEVRFKVPPASGNDGTDLRVNVEGSTWINCFGEGNFPDGEVFAGPKGVDGHVNYTYPAVYNGREVLGVRLAFKGGRVVDASADKNEEFLIKMLDQDAGARTLGEIAIGTNYGIKNFSRNTLFDEKIGGTFHAAVGAGYPSSGNSNQSGLHWDMVCDLRPNASGHPGGTVEADGEVFHAGGKFLKPGWPGNQ